MISDEFYMQRCIDLAQLGEGYVAPNPMVGAVIVKEGKILGEGYHKSFGEAHAEVNAVNSVHDKTELAGATIYVSLEPCAHFGKTPPCSDLLIQHNFKRVVIGCIDPYSEVKGKGIAKLEKAGIEVTTGVLEKKCIEVNKRFFTFHQKKRPYVILKWAQSKDGFIDSRRQENQKGINWISQPETQILVHKWRSEEQSILIGRKTVQNDDPSLTVREVHGKNPIRIIIDSQLKTSNDSKIFDGTAPTIILNKLKAHCENNVEWIKLEQFDTQSIMHKLYEMNIQSVFIEGGSKTLQHFIIDQCWDEARVIIGQNLLNEGLNAPKIADTPIHSFSFFGDKIYLYKKRKI